MVREGDAVLLDPFAARNRHRPMLEEMFLVDQDEQDIVAAGRLEQRPARPSSAALSQRFLAISLRSRAEGGAACNQRAA